MIDYSQRRYERWWTKSRKDEVHHVVSGLVSTLRSRQVSKRKMDILHAKIYGNYDVSGTGNMSASVWEIMRGDDGRMRFQLCTSAVDTALAILTANKPVPYYLTDGAEWSEQRKAKKKARIVAGQLMDLDAYDIAQRCARDALVFGTGIVYGYVDDDGKVGIERVLPGEILVDHGEAASGYLTQIFRRRMMATERAVALWPEKADMIRRSASPTQSDWDDRHLSRDGTVDMVMITEAWHLPSREGASDGRHIICTDQTTLVDVEWHYDWFPFADMRWKQRLTGWWGCGLIEETKAAQLRINRLIRHYEKCQNGSNVYVFVDRNSGLDDYEITNAPLQIIPYNTGSSPPVIYKADGSLFDLRGEIGAIRDDTYQQVGISTSQLQGEKPKGVNSGRAIRLAEDIGSRRHIDNVRQYEAFFVKLTKLLERLNDVAQERDESYSVSSVETRGRTEIKKSVKWSEVKTKSSTTVRMFPVSSLGSTPAGKMESVQELVKGGFLNRNYAMKLLDYPDLDSALSLELIDLDLVHWQLDKIQDGDMGVVPLPIQNLEVAFEESRKVRLQAEMLDASEDVKSELQRYRDAVQRMLMMADQANQMRQQAAQQQQMASQQQVQQSPSPEMAEQIGQPQLAVA